MAPYNADHLNKFPHQTPTFSGSWVGSQVNPGAEAGKEKPSVFALCAEKEFPHILGQEESGPFSELGQQRVWQGCPPDLTRSRDMSTLQVSLSVESGKMGLLKGTGLLASEENPAGRGTRDSLPGISKMVELYVRVLASKPHSLSSSPGISMVEGQN